MKSFLPLTVLCCVVAAAAGQSAIPQAAYQPTGVETLDVYETAIRYQIKTWELAANSYCIEINGKDAEKELLQRLTPLPVKGRSGCRKHVIAGVMMQVEDKKSKKIAVIFDLGDIHWRSDSEAEVHGGYFCGSTCMAGGLYHIVRDSSGWHVTGFDIQTIS